MMKKKLLACVMGLAMLLTACGNTAGSSETEEKPAETIQEKDVQNEEETEDTGDMPNLVMNFVYLEVPSDLEMVEEAINEITKEKIGCTVTLNAYTYGNIADQQTLILSSPSEQWDLMCGQFRSGITSYVGKGQLTPLNSLLEEYGKDITATLGEGFIKATSVNGECYEITTCRNLAAQECVLFDKAIIEELGLEEKVAAARTYSDLTEIFAAIREAHPEMYTTMSSGTKPNLIIAGIDGQDILGDALGVLMDAQNPTVTNLFESEEYRELCKMAKSWNDAGYIYPDIITDDSNNGNTMMANNLCASFFTSYKPGSIVENQNTTKKELVAAMVNNPLVVTSGVQNWGWAIPTNAKYPEKAMQLLNLLFCDEELINLLSFGVENYHWTMNDEGFATAGEHAEGYSDRKTWLSGNAYIGAIWEGDDADLYDQLQAFNNDAEQSVALGFSFDSSEYTAEYTAMQSVISQYRMLLEWGFVSDVDATLAEFNKALYDAGLQTYMDAKQEQLDAYVAGQ